MNLHPKKRSAYRRGEKVVIFFKRGIIVLSIFVSITIVAMAVKLSARNFLIKDIQVSGNYHLEEEEIKDGIVRNGESLFMLSFDEIETRVSRLPWIKKMSLRKQFPHTLMIDVEEATPKALLSLDSHLFLVDSDGNILEEIIDKGPPFLPVIVGINPKKDRGGILEALKLVDTLAGKNILLSKESIKIMLSSYGLVLNMDGENVRVGYGEYGEKLDRWKELEPELRKKNIIIDYIDLRFKDKVIIKPLKAVEKSSDANAKEKKGSKTNRKG